MSEMSTATARTKKDEYTVSTFMGNPRFLELTHDIHWFGPNYGILLGDYEITRRSDPSWFATFTVVMGPDNNLKLANLSMESKQGLTSASFKLPYKLLLNACKRAGLVVKTW